MQILEYCSSYNIFYALVEFESLGGHHQLKAFARYRVGTPTLGGLVGPSSSPEITRTMAYEENRTPLRNSSSPVGLECFQLMACQRSWLAHNPVTVGVTGSNPVQVAKFMSLSSRGLGHHPFTVSTGVRIPVGTPSYWGIVKWYHNRF